MSRHFVVKRLLFGAGIVAAALIGCYVFLNARLDDVLFHRVVNDPMLVKQWQGHRVEIPAGDITLEGWWAGNPSGKSNAVIVYFGGNAEDVLYTAGTAAQFSANRMFLSNYRGYGATSGKPSQPALYQDALAVYDYVVRQPGVSGDSVILMGRSLGSGVATFVAAHRAVRGVVLITPYDSIAAVAQEHDPWLAVRGFLRNKFPSDELAHRVTAPVLIVAGERDVLIPPIHAQRLYQAWGGPRQIHVLSGVGHNDIAQHPQYYPLINAFLERTPFAQ